MSVYCVCVCVTQSSLDSFSGRLLLGVAASCVSLYQPGEAEPLDSFPIGQICSYAISDPHTLRISTGDRDLLLQTSQVGHTHTCNLQQIHTIHRMHTHHSTSMGLGRYL